MVFVFELIRLGTTIRCWVFAATMFQVKITQYKRENNFAIPAYCCSWNYEVTQKTRTVD